MTRMASSRRKPMGDARRSPRARGAATRALICGALALVASACAGPRPAPASARGGAEGGRAHLRILALNDFHGQLEPAEDGDGRGPPGAAALAGWIRGERARAPGPTLLVSAGDLVGATPPISGLLQDEPTIMFLGALGNAWCVPVAPERRGDLDALAGDPRCDVVATSGNHELDAGWSELVRLWRGGTHPRGPFLEEPWRGARFPLVSANIVDRASGAPLLPSHVVRELDGVRVGVIGAVTRQAPDLLDPAGIANLSFRDEARSINEAARALAGDGVRAIVVLLHDGGEAPPYDGATSPFATIPEHIASLVASLDPEIDVLVTAHKHGFTNVFVPNGRGRPVLVTQAFSAGRGVAEIDLELDRATGDVAASSARIVRVPRDTAPDAAVAALVARARDAVAARLARRVAIAAAPIRRVALPPEPVAGGSPLGDLVADAFRAAAAADAAVVQPGNLRADLPAGEIPWGAVYAVLPFPGAVTAVELSGAELLGMLERQWKQGAEPRFLGISGLRYSWDACAADGHRVVRAEVAGRPIDPARRYTVAMSSFLAGGGGGFGFLASGHRKKATGIAERDALERHVARLEQPIGPALDGRVALAGPPAPCAARPAAPAR